MTSVIETLTGILTFLENLWYYIQNMFKGLGYVIEYIEKTIAIEWRVIGTFPAWVGGFATIAIFMTLTLVIVGRYHGK